MFGFYLRPLPPILNLANVYVCLYAYVYVSLPPLNVMGRVGPHIYIYIHIHTYTYIYIHMDTYTYIWIHIHTYTYIRVCGLRKFRGNSFDSGIPFANPPRTCHGWMVVPSPSDKHPPGNLGLVRLVQPGVPSRGRFMSNYWCCNRQLCKFHLPTLFICHRRDMQNIYCHWIQ